MLIGQLIDHPLLLLCKQGQTSTTSIKTIEHSWFCYHLARYEQVSTPVWPETKDFRFSFASAVAQCVWMDPYCSGLSPSLLVGDSAGIPSSSHGWQ